MTSTSGHPERGVSPGAGGNPEPGDNAVPVRPETDPDAQAPGAAAVEVGSAVREGTSAVAGGTRAPAPQGPARPPAQPSPGAEVGESAYWTTAAPANPIWETGLPASGPMRPVPPQWWSSAVSHWWPEIAVGVAVLVLSAWAGFSGSGLAGLVFVFVAMAAAMSFRRRPGVGLALLWITAGLIYVSGTASLGYTFILTVPVLAFGCARHGSRATRVFSVLSMLAVPVVAGAALLGPSAAAAIDTWRTRGPGAIPWAAAISRVLPLALAWLALVVLPWGAGRFMRSLDIARIREAEAQERRARAERERGYAQQVADLKAGQAQLARDVHDVVGHSLAVILAQAESAQYLRDDETDKMRETLANVATSARRSLQDVRAVLSPSTSPNQPPATGLDALVDGVATAGNDVRRAVRGTPRALPPELEQIAYRVLQEMLTNALKHGHRGGPVWVEQDWPADWRSAYLRFEVRNLIDDATTQQVPTGVPRGGLGLDGMRYRLESAGGQLAAQESTEAGGRVFTATAWLPLRAAEVDVEGTR